MAFYQVLTNITIQQIPSDKWASRDLIITIPFLHKYEGDSTYANLTQNFKLEIPKRVRVRVTSKSNPNSSSLISLANVSEAYSNMGGFAPNVIPVFMSGDIVTVNVGYRAFVNDIEQTQTTGFNTYDPTNPPLFQGYISHVKTKMSITLTCEDNMWLLKQIPTPIKTWNSNTIQTVVQSMLDANSATGDKSIINKYAKYGVNLKISDYSKTDLVFNVSNLISKGENLASFLARLKKQYHVDSYFRGNELRIGYTHYVPTDLKQYTFTFQKNIISDSLVWKCKDDIVLSMIVKSHYKVTSTGSTKDGSPKTTMKCTEILIFNPNGKDGLFQKVSKTKGVDFPPNEEGERHTMMLYSNITDENQLFKIGVTQLQKFYYDGFRGSFTTFGLPHVKHGDMVVLVDPLLPERNGEYMVKRVDISGGADEGLRQTIHLDYKILS